MNNVIDFLRDFGIWTILVLTLMKFVLGVLVAIQKDEFKWFYVGNFFKSDGVKLATFAIILGVGKYGGIPEFNSDLVVGGLSAALVLDLAAGIIKNLAHIFPSFADQLPSAFREPARLRLGNPKNLP